MAKLSKSKYCQFWWNSLTELDLSPTEALLIHLIDGLSKKRGFCYMSKSNLAGYLGVGVSTIYATLNKLERKGLIIRESEYDSTGMKSTKIYTTKKWSDFVSMEEFGFTI